MWNNYIFLIITLYKNIKSDSIDLSNEIFTEIEIGTPIQKIPININFENYLFFISGSELKNLTNNIFNESNSLTYKKNSSFPYEISHNLIKKGYFSNDTIILNNNKINEFIFILAYKELYGIFWLRKKNIL